MFSRLAKFEFNYFRKQPSFYVVSLIFFLLTFLAMTIENVQIGGGGSNVNFNSPQAITNTMIIMSIIGMFLVANFVGGTATKDHTFKMNGIVHSMPVNKGSYLWGRLLGAWLFCLLVFATVPLGTLLGSLMPWVDGDRLGATSLYPYLSSYLIFIVPNFIFTAALFYAFAMITRSMMGMYLGVVGFFILFSFSGQFLRDPSLVTLSAMLDPFGIRAFSQVTKYWTPFEMNTKTVGLDGLVLQNRMLWLTISACIIALTHFFIDIRKTKKIKTGKSIKQSNREFNKDILVLTPTTSTTSQWSRFRARTQFEIKQVIKSPAFIILCILSLFNLSSLFIGSSGSFGTDDWPLTRSMTDHIAGSFGLLIMIIITYYAGETVWRERQIGMGDIVESTPTKNWALYFPKVLALFTVVFSLLAIGILFTTLFQASKGYTNFEWSVYFIILGTEFLIPVLMTCILSIFFQVIAPNKYMGMLAFVIFFIVSIVINQLGLEHNLWNFTEAPAAPYSDLNQYGHFVKPLIAYNLYWLGLTIILVVLGYGLFRRGAEYGLKYRWSQLRNTLGSKGFMSMLFGLVLFVGMGSYIYYNTTILNKFLTSDETSDLQASYEKAYKQFEDSPVAKITDVNLKVDMFPYQRKVEVDGFYIVQNKTSEPIAKSIISWDQSSTVEIKSDKVSIKDFDETYKTGWLNFNPALMPGESRKIKFKVLRQAKGFVDSNSDNSIVANGSFINNFTLLPHFGYNASYELVDRQERKKRDMAPPQRMAKLEDESMYRTNFVGKESDFISYEAVVSTSDDQFAITPGYLQKKWSENGRNYYHYKMDAPIFNFFAFLSGKYEVVKETHDGISIEVYHHKTHDKNVKIMIEAVKVSLDYFKQVFSPYQHSQVRIIEFPRYASFAQSFANTIPYSEDIGFIADLRDEDKIDWVSFVTAHEMGHQWWGHQVTPADVQGSAVLSESLSEYSAYLAMEQLYGEHHLRKFLKYEMDRYLRGRSGEILEEMPLMRAENQQYIHYPKGGIVMYSLKDRLGEENFNLALRRFLEEFQYQSDPYPTTLDLIRHIKTVAGADDMQFIEDVFAKITLFDLKTKSATAKKLENGNYQVDLTIEAGKFYADGKGEETKSEVNDYFDIGIFSSNPDQAKDDSHVLKFDKEMIKTGENKFSFQVKETPKYAGVDPYIKMIDRNSDDNMIQVELIED
jgi:ABC-2 type transport system permease protein